MSKLTDVATKALQSLQEHAESDNTKKRIQLLQDLAGKAGSASLELGKQGAKYTALTAKRTYTGIRGFKDSKTVAADAQGRYEEALADFKQHVEAIQERVHTFETAQKVVMATSVARFVELWERQQKKVKLREHDFQVRLHLTPNDVQAFHTAQITSVELAGGLGAAAIAGAGVGTAAVAAATTLGTASTGIAISGLSGAAANSALLAWFGGGSLAVGGGGMALGALVVGSIFVAPAVLVGALVAARKGEQRLTKAREYSAEVDVAIEEMRLRVSAFDAVRQRMDELEHVLSRLDQVLLHQVQRCEHFERKGKTDGPYEDMFANLVFQAYSTCVTLTQVLRVPVVDDAFQVTVESADTLGAARALLGGQA